MLMGGAWPWPQPLTRMPPSLSCLDMHHQSISCPLLESNERPPHEEKGDGFLSNTLIVRGSSKLGHVMH